MCYLCWCKNEFEMCLFIGSAIRTILIIIAVFVLARFVGKLFSVKRDIADNNKRYEEQENFHKEKERVARDNGKVEVLKNNNTEAEEVDFEELKN